MSVLGAIPVPMISTRANSAFEIEQLESAPPEWVGGQLGHTRWKKRFHGDLVGTSTVEAVTCMVPDGPMLYVAIERFDCILDGKAGTFLLTHRAVAVGEQSPPSGSLSMAPEPVSLQASAVPVRSPTITIFCWATGCHDEQQLPSKNQSEAVESSMVRSFSTVRRLRAVVTAPVAVTTLQNDLGTLVLRTPRGSHW